MTRILDMYAAFSYIWGLGGPLSCKGKLKFEYFARQSISKFLSYFPEKMTVFVSLLNILQYSLIFI